MKTDRPSHKPFEPYPISIKKHVRLLIAWGHENAKPEMDTDDEEEITGLLYNAVERILDSGRKRWFSKYDVKNEDPISSGKRRGKKRRAIDLVFIITTAPRPKYVFEVKPLNYPKKHQRTGNYTNREGMGRFLKGEYADYTANYPEIGMLGYVLSDTPEVWQDRLKTAINKKKSELQLISEQREVKIIDAFPLEWMSEHNRSSSGRPLEIYHILLDCRC